MPSLVIMRGREEVDRRPLFEDIVTIGRCGIGSNDRPDIILPDKLRQISRYHAAIVLNRYGRYFARDLGSATGITVNGQSVYRRILQNSDRIGVGPYSLIYLEEGVDVSRERPIIPVESSPFLSTGPDRRPTRYPTFLKGENLQLPKNLSQLLNDIVKEMKPLKGSDVFLQRFVELVALALEAERGFIGLTNAEMVFGKIATFGIDEEKGERMEYPASTITSVIQTSKPSIEESTFLGTSVVCCPIKSKSRLIGVVYLDRVDRKPFSMIDLRFLALASQQGSLLLAEEGLHHRPRKLDGVVATEFRWNSHIVAKAKSMKRVCQQIRDYAKCNDNILLLGETGTGKEVFAQEVHHMSTRKSGPYVVVELPGIGKDLLESELFGHRKGAFTGASRDKQGCFEQANGGTLFMDEIGDISLHMQAKIRRAVEEKEIRKVGTTRMTKVDVRIISATNVDLNEKVKEGSFKNDLLERLGAQVRLPPLRERKEDIPLLLHYFVDRCMGSFKGISHGAMRLLLDYHWPGNVRELRKLIETFSTSDKEVLHIWHLPSKMKREELATTIPVIIKNEIKGALLAENWNITRAAKSLSISRQTLYNKMKEFEITRPKKAST
jgi:transcriptional regulator with PAS, ATPase and Fis domain